MPLPDASSLDTYGGSKANYGVGPVDPSTDDDADEINKMKADVAMGTRMVPRCETVFTGHATTPVYTTHEAVWKGATATAPTIARAATGRYTITYASSVNDELVIAHTLNLKRAWAQAEGTTAYHVQARVTSVNVITVDVFDMAGVANDAVGVTLVAWAR